MLSGTENFANHAYYTLWHVTVSHMCAYMHTQITLPKLNILQTPEHISLLVSSLSASNSPPDIAFVSYLQSRLRTSKARVLFFKIDKAAPFAKPAPSSTGTRKVKSSVLHSYLCALPVNLGEGECLMNIYRHHRIKH